MSHFSFVSAGYEFPTTVCLLKRFWPFTSRRRAFNGVSRCVWEWGLWTGLYLTDTETRKKESERDGEESGRQRQLEEVHAVVNGF